MLREGQTSELMSERLRYAFLEVSRFDKPKEACNTFEERFLYLMKNLPTFAEEPELWGDPYFKDMMEEAEYAKMTMEQRYQYAMSMKQKWDLANQITFAAACSVVAREESRPLSSGYPYGQSSVRSSQSFLRGFSPGARR